MAEPRALFVVGEREASATSLRVLQVPARLARAGWRVDLLTESEAVAAQARERYGEEPRVEVTVARFDDRFWTMRQRDAFAKTFIRLYSDLVVPGTDMPFWKMVAFDDFLWHVSRYSMARIEGTHDAVVLAAPSAYERPRDQADVMYTNAVYHARRLGVPAIGLQVYPHTDLPALLVQVLDEWVVGDEQAAAHLLEQGVGRERVHLPADPLERHLLASVGDPLLERLLDPGLEAPDGTLTVSLINHPSNRLQLRQAIEAVGRVPGEKRVFFCFVGLNVRELTEEDVFEDLLAPALRERVGTYYTVGTQSMMPVLLASDVIVSTNYLRPLALAARYGRCAVVFDPLREPVANLDERVRQLTDAAELEALVREAASRRAGRCTLARVLERARERRTAHPARRARA
ncbi:MAG TPA: hypothetical protein ENK20_04315 [Chromatiales bacterium]|nr:hypothetical protein [Chromatiales bacterium]